MAILKHRVHGHCNVKVSDIAIDAVDESTGKPYLILEFPAGTTVAITTNLAELIGGVGAGTRQRWEERNARGKVH